MTTRLPFRKATSLATLAAFVAVVCFAEPALAHATRVAPQVSPAPAPQARLQIEHDPLACVTTVVAPLVEAKVGRGTWTYVGLGLFRQLPAATPGAYRLLANLVSRPRGR